MLKTSNDKYIDINQFKNAKNSFYERLSQKRGDSKELKECIIKVTELLCNNNTTPNKPGMLLGKIQSGKTMAFLGVIAKCFDNEFDIAIVLTKGTKALVKQTVSRIKRDFKEFDEDDRLKVFDIMCMPDRLSEFETEQKIILVAKKQYQNLEKIIEFFKGNTGFNNKKVLLIDDEADLASIRFVKKEDDEVVQGRISQLMDTLREKLHNISFLQVTATPYSLYLQPEHYRDETGNTVFLPKKPAFTELVPIHDRYVGGDDYFGDFADDNLRAFLYKEVSIEEQNILRKEDRRSTRDILKNKNLKVIRESILNFIIGGCIRHYQLEENKKKFSFIIHNDTVKKAHKWQIEIVEDFFNIFSKEITFDDGEFKKIFEDCYRDIIESVSTHTDKYPNIDICFKMVCDVFKKGHYAVIGVNSDSDVEKLLDENSELKLRTPFNVFIGGNILDRGITIPNLISFYYGRNPKKMQSDTVLQHSRMYGSRELSDLAVTRFYTSKIVYDRLKKIHEFDTALRESFEKNLNSHGVIFLENDDEGRIIPCSPDKIQMSQITSIRPSKKMSPFDFEINKKIDVDNAVFNIDNLILSYKSNYDSIHDIDLILFNKIVDNLEKTIKIDKELWDWQVVRVMMKHYGENGIKLLTYTGREIKRLRKDGHRIANISYSEKDSKLMKQHTNDKPMLFMTKQTGKKENGWTGASFWWPVFVVPNKATPIIYANNN